MRFLGGDLAAILFFVAASLLVAGGASKLRRPDPTSRALSAAGIPHAVAIARVLGATEVLLGALALTVPRPPVALAVGALYLSFAAFLAYLMTGGLRASSCGCLGQRETPPSIVHVCLDALAAVISVRVAFIGPPGVVGFAEQLPLWGTPFLLGVPLLAYLVYLVVAFLPELVASVRTTGTDAGNSRRAAIVSGRRASGS